jgi:sugar lactone lactonase YvrE
MKRQRPTVSPRPRTALFQHVSPAGTATALVALVAAGAVAADGGVTEAWVLEGLSTPESAVHDAARGVFYVSNIAGEPLEANGAGHLSRVSLDGAMLEAEWVTGLNAPKGLALDGDTLYVTDLDRLVAIDVESGEIGGTWPLEGARFLNDVTVAGDGRVFASDMVRHAIYVLEGDAVSVWLEDEALQHPNGLKVDAGRLIVAPWGIDMQEDFTTLTGGHLLAIDLETREIAPLGAGTPVGNLDGIEPDGSGNWPVTDWIAGGLLRIDPDGGAETLVDLPMGSADIGFVPEDRLVIVPMMLDDRLVAYRLE